MDFPHKTYYVHLFGMLYDPKGYLSVPSACAFCDGYGMDSHLLCVICNQKCICINCSKFAFFPEILTIVLLFNAPSSICSICWALTY